MTIKPTRYWSRTLAHQGRVQTAYLQELTAALGRTYEAVSTLAEKGPVIYHGNL